MRFVVAGGTGFVGNRLVDHLIRGGHSVVVLSRRERQSSSESISFCSWDMKLSDKLVQSLEGVDVVVNLAGEPIAAKRWTKTQKAKIIQSRLDATSALVEAIGRTTCKPQALINASAIGLYGASDDTPLFEDSKEGTGFLAQTCAQWESAAKKAESHGVRTVTLRIGIVLGVGGGALSKMLPPFRFFIGGPLGSGRQWMSWVHVDDLARLVEFIACHKTLHGPVNATAPKPVTMKEFARTLGGVLRRPAVFPVPGFVLKLLLGELSDMLLEGQKVLPEKAIQAGFRFKFAGLEEALKDLL